MERNQESTEIKDSTMKLQKNDGGIGLRKFLDLCTSFLVKKLEWWLILVVSMDEEEIY